MKARFTAVNLVLPNTIYSLNLYYTINTIL